jgi:apolipoprotein N-acyltransferase
LLHIYPWTWAAALASPPQIGRAAAFLGTEGFTAIVWIVGVLAGCFLAKGEIKKAAISLVSMLVFLLTLSGAWHLLPRGQELALDIAIVQPNYPVNTRIPNQLADMWQRSDALLQKSGLPNQDKPTLLLWSESSVMDGNYLLPDLDYLADIVGSRKVAWLFGTDGWLERNSPLNLVRGEVAGQRPFLQAKVVPMPFGERMPGPDWMRERLEKLVGFKSWMPGELSPDSSFTVPSQPEPIKIHPIICSEALIPSRVRSGLIIAGGDLLTEHTNDAWFETSIAADLHASMVRLRALEAGIPIVRATMSGRSGLVREDGTWQHFSNVMTDGAWSFELKWRPIHAPARTAWPFYSLLFLLISGIGLLAWPIAKGKNN